MARFGRPVDRGKSPMGPYRREDPVVLFMVHRLSRSLMRASMAYYLQEFGLGVPQVQILNSIGSLGPMLSKEIADHTAMNKALVSRSLSELTGSGYTEMRPDAGDARRRVWRLTARGQDFVTRFRPVRIERTTTLLKTLSDSEQDALVDVLDRLYNASEAQRCDEARALAARHAVADGAKERDVAAAPVQQQAAQA
jgi:DNA-binding MarR family transcriptional regulator